MAEIADGTLPLCPFRINWKAGLSERLEWKTDVLPDFLGNEQRRALRLTPRREFEATISLWDEDRQFWDLWLHRMAGGEFLFPVWHDSVRAAQAAPQGQNTIWVDTRGLEFRIGSYGLLRAISALSCERFKIAQVLDDRIITVEPLNADWPKGTRVEPLIRGRLTDQTSVSAKSSRVSETQAVFEATHEQPYDEGVDSWDQYLGMPVLGTQPNRSEDVTQQFAWAFSESDSLTGRRYRSSDTRRAVVHQKHNWLLHGRTAKAAFRSLLYRLRGSQRPIWLPTFSEDMTLSRNAAPAATSIYVKAFGFGYTGGPTSGREFICIWLRNGTRLYRKITGTLNSGTLAEERLALDVALPGGLAMADVRMISWMDTARFENDRIEFGHVNAADGASTVSGVFQTFRDQRQAPAILQLPLPAAAKGAEPCGTDIPEEDHCAPIFPGWYLKVMYSTDSPGYDNGPNFFPANNWNWPCFQPNPHVAAGCGAGKTICGLAGPFVPQHVEREYGSPDDPCCVLNTFCGQPLITGEGDGYNFSLTFWYDQPPGTMGLQIQYGVDNWSAVGLPGSPMHVDIMRWDWKAPIRVLDGHIGGLWPYYFEWQV